MMLVNKSSQRPMPHVFCSEVLINLKIFEDELKSGKLNKILYFNYYLNFYN